MEVKLIQESEYGTREVLVDADEFVIGREISCNLRLDHGKVGWRHCRIMKKIDRLLVEDLNSPTGTAINRERLDDAPAELYDGDRLDLGPVSFRVVVAGGKVRPSRGARPTDADEWPENTELHQSARLLLDRMVAEEPKPHGSSRRHGDEEKRPILDVVDKDGVALVRVGRRALVRELDLARMQEGLEDLIEAGKDRIALSFLDVEHLSSQCVGTLIRAQRRCKASGGELKICQARPQVGEVFAITNLDRIIEIVPDETGALKGRWPERRPGSARPKPAQAAPAPASAPAREPHPPTPAPVDPWARLLVVAGRNQGQVIEVRRTRFAIGRDERCQLRPVSQTVDPIHAILERRDDRAFLRDCGSSLGTIIGQRLIRSEEAEIHGGERFQVGQLILEFHFAGRAAEAEPDEADSSAGFPDGPDSSVGADSSPALEPVSG